MYTYTHVYIHVYIHVYMYTYIHTYLHTYLHTCIQTNTLVPSVSSEGYSSDESVSSDLSTLTLPPSILEQPVPERKQRCLEHLSLVWCSQITDECVIALKVGDKKIQNILSQYDLT